MLTIAKRGVDIKLFIMSVRIFLCYASYVCYKNLENDERLAEVRNQMISFFIDQMNNGEENNHYSPTALPDYLNFLLFLEVFEYTSKMRSLHHNGFMFMKTKVIKQIADHMKMRDSQRNVNNNHTQGTARNNQDFSDPRFQLFCSCNMNE